MVHKEYSNYRICHRSSSTVPSLGIHEFFYDSKGRIIFYSNNPVVPFGDDLGELMEEVKEMMIAFEKEVIDLDYIDIKIMKNREEI
jgi:hypothetical protein